MSGGDVEGWVERLRRLGRDVIFRAICVLTLVTASVGFAFQHPDQGDKLNAPAEVVRPDERIADYTFWLMAFTGILGVVSISILFSRSLRSDNQENRECLDPASQSGCRRRASDTRCRTGLR